MDTDPTLVMLLAAAVLVGCAVGVYWGITRARAPLGAPEPQEIIERRQRFKAAHLGQAKAAFVVASLLFLAALGAFIGAHI